MKITDKNHPIYLRYPILLSTLEDLEIRRVADNTIYNYISGIARFLDYTELKDPESFDTAVFRNYILHLQKDTNLAPSSINANNAYIRFFYEATLDRPYNVRKVPKMRSDIKEPAILTDSQIISLLNASSADSMIDCIIKFGLCAGLRINEIATLRVRDIDTERMLVHVARSKRNRERYVPIDATLYQALRRYSREYHLKIDSLLFTFRCKDHTSCQTIRYHFYFYRDAAGIPDDFVFHNLRHTYAVNFLLAKGDILNLKYYMGHSSLASTSRYLHLTKELAQQVPSHIDQLLGGNLNG